jgi:hypothetical protein
VIGVTALKRLASAVRFRPWPPFQTMGGLQPSSGKEIAALSAEAKTATSEPDKKEVEARGHCYTIDLWSPPCRQIFLEW